MATCKRSPQTTPHLLTWTVRRVAVVLALFWAFSGSAAVYACDPGAISWVSLVPLSIDVPVGGQATVSAVVRCRTNGGDFTNGKSGSFDVRLVDLDEAAADVLDVQTVTVLADPGEGFRANHTLRLSFSLRCTPEGIVGLYPSGEGLSDGSDAADLALQIDHGMQVVVVPRFAHNLPGNPAAQQPVSAQCMPGLINHLGAAEESVFRQNVVDRQGNALRQVGLALEAEVALPTAPLVGAYDMASFVHDDPGGLGTSFFSLPQRLEVNFVHDEVTLGGMGDWIDLRGRLGEDGRLTAKGAGKLGAFAQAHATFEGTFAHGLLEGMLTLEVAALNRSVVVRIEGRSRAWAAFWGQVAQRFQAAAEQTARVNFDTAALGVDLSPTMLGWTEHLLDATAAAQFGPAQALGAPLVGMGHALDQLGSQLSFAGLERRQDAQIQLNRAADQFAEAERVYQQILETSIVPKVITRFSIESALDHNANGRIDDDEVLEAVQLWVKGQRVSGTMQTIDDGEILVLVELWILDRLIGSTPQASGTTLLLELLKEFLSALNQAGHHLRAVGELLLP